MKQKNSGTITEQGDQLSRIGTRRGGHGAETRSNSDLPSTAGIEVATPTPQHDKSLSPQELADHRQKIAFEVKTILSAYFQPFEAEDIKAAQLAWWCDTLVEWTHEQIVYALRKWNEENPRLRPTPGDILSMLKEKRGKAIASRMKKSESKDLEQRERVSKEAANEILAQAGFGVRRFGGE